MNELSRRTFGRLVGAGVAASAVCLDKVLFKELMSAIAVPQVDYVGIRAAHFARDPDAALARTAALGLPVFVKPAHLGSSVGIVKVDAAADMRAALEQAFAHDALAIVEAMAPGVEVECGVLGTLGAAAGEEGEDEQGGQRGTDGLSDASFSRARMQHTFSPCRVHSKV